MRKGLGREQNGPGSNLARFGGELKPAVGETLLTEQQRANLGDDVLRLLARIDALNQRLAAGDPDGKPDKQPEDGEATLIEFPLNRRMAQVALDAAGTPDPEAEEPSAQAA